MRHWIEVGANIAAKLGHICLPQSCYLCGAQPVVHMVCSACVRDLPPAPSVACEQCGIALEAPGLVCGRCLTDPPHFSATLARFSYTFPVDRLVSGLKFQEQLGLARFLAEALISIEKPNVDVLVPVPLHPKRLAERGFDQVRLVTQALSCSWGIPMNTSALQRARHDPPQRSLGWQKRLKNVQGAFSAKPDLAGLRVAVVDDVMTTGATLRVVAKTLKASGAGDVINIVLARTPMHQNS